MEKRSRATGKFLKGNDKQHGFHPLGGRPSNRKNNGGLKVIHRENKMESTILCVGAESQVTGYHNVVQFAESPNTVGTSNEGILNAPGRILHTVKHALVLTSSQQRESD